MADLVYKFTELSTIASLVDVQVVTLEAFVQREEDPEKLKIFKNELSKMKSLRTKTKKLITAY